MQEYIILVYNALFEYRDIFDKNSKRNARLASGE